MEEGGVSGGKVVKTFFPLMVDCKLKVILFNYMNGAAVAVMHLFVAEGPHVMNKIPELAL